MSEPYNSTFMQLSPSHGQYVEQLSDQDFWSYAARLASASPAATNPVAEFLACGLGEGQCIFPLVSLREVVPPPHHVTLLPATPSWMLGITSWHGETIAVIDLFAYLTRQVARMRTDHTLLVVQNDEVAIGLFVEALGSLTTLRADHLDPPEYAGRVFPHLARLPVGVVSGVYRDALLLHIPAVLADMVQHMRVIAPDE